MKKALLSAAESKAERAALLCEVQPVNSLIQRYSKYLVLIKAYYVIFELFHFNNETKRSKLVFRACFCYLSEQRCLFSQEKRQSCLKVTLKSIRRTSLSGLEHSVCFSTHEHIRGGEVRFSREERRAAPSSPFLDRFGDV